MLISGFHFRLVSVSRIGCNSFFLGRPDGMTYWGFCSLAGGNHLLSAGALCTQGLTKMVCSYTSILFFYFKYCDTTDYTAEHIKAR